MGLSDRVDGLIHEPTQTNDRGVDLTVDEVYRVHDAGQLDFGGDEATDPELLEELAEPRAEGDEYGWWTLTAGTYLIEYNESLVGDDPVVLQPHRRLFERGVSHPTLSCVSLPRVPFNVAGELHLKENARVSTLLPDVPR